VTILTEPATAPAPPRQGDDGALERLLSSLEWRVIDIRRMTIDEPRSLVLEPGHATLVYVVDGTVDAPPATPGCDLATVSRLSPESSLLSSGDALLSLGRTRVGLGLSRGSSLTIARLRTAAHAELLLSAVPDVLTVTGFARIEPAAAALAGHLGFPATTDDLPTGEAPVLCRMMATTLALATLRAWAVAGCAPEGWPARTADPFLARVLDAIHADPGREWTLEQLAALGAMSRSVFAARFRAELGSSPLSYLTRVRMDAAKTLLADGDASVSEASRLLGYSSDEGFSRAFRRHTGMAPSQWRAQRRSAQAGHR
jgi:AraC-like DNA-binding protein